MKAGNSNNQRGLKLDHWRRQWQPTPVLLSGKSQGRRSLVGCSPWGHYESDTTKRLHFHALEKQLAAHSSVLAWRIPGTGEPGGLPSMGLHRVGHNRSDLAAAAAKLDHRAGPSSEWQASRGIQARGLGRLSETPAEAQAAAGSGQAGVALGRSHSTHSLSPFALSWETCGCPEQGAHYLKSSRTDALP